MAAERAASSVRVADEQACQRRNENVGGKAEATCDDSRRLHSYLTVMADSDVARRSTRRGETICWRE